MSKVFYKKVAHKFLSKFICNLITKETLAQVYFCEFSKILPKIKYLNTKEHLQMAGYGSYHTFICLTP